MKLHDDLIIAFVQGAQYWEYESTGATMWSADRNRTEKVAEARLAAGTLGKLPHPPKPTAHWVTSDMKDKISRSAAGPHVAVGVCIVCGSALVLAFWRGHPDNRKVHCNDCGSEVTAWMHAKKQPDEKETKQQTANAPTANRKLTEARLATTHNHGGEH